MAKQFTYTCYKASFQSIIEIMDHMKMLHKELEGTHLENLQYFTLTYFIITKNVFAKLDSGYFVNDLTMKTLDIHFAKYYFDALKLYVDGKKTTPAWEIMFEFCKKDSSMPLIYLALGVNAHVNNDLGLCLFDVVKKPSFKSDFDRVNKVISKSLDEVISEVGLPKIYKLVMQVLIRRWRNKAWTNYVNLEDNTKNKTLIENAASLLAEKLTQVNSPKDFYHLFAIF